MLRTPILTACMTLALTATAAAGDLVITNVKVAGHDGLVAIVIRDGTIRKVGRRLTAPRNAPRIDAAGAWAVPGRIDAWATVSGGSPLGKALDGFDSYDDAARQEALSQGVTTVCLTPDREFEGACGTAQVIKLRPGVHDPSELVIVAESAVCAGLGGLGEAPLVRARRYGKLDQQLRDARRYRDSWVDYEESLETYVESIGGDTAKVDSKTPSRKPPEGTAPAPLAEGPKPAKGKKKDEGPKKPKQPKIVRLMELLARVLDRELPLRIEAQRAEDVISALELQSRHGFRLILEGGSEAHRVAGTLDSSDAAVVLGQTLRARPPGGEPLEFARDPRAPNRNLGWARANPGEFTPRNASLLAAAGVEPVLATGAWSRSRFVTLNAALAAGAGLSQDEAEAGITSRAAAVLGLGDRLGRVAPGYDADLVLTDSPLDGAAKLVVVDGDVVFRKDG